MLENSQKILINTKRSLVGRIYKAAYHLILRLLDYFYAFLNMRQNPMMPGYVFDDDWYKKKNTHSPTIENFKGTMAQHYYLHGMKEGCDARFFDTFWYYENHNDYGLARIDAWSHFRQFGINEGREARFIYTDAQIQSSNSFDYTKWVSLYDHGGKSHLENLKRLIDRYALKCPFSLIVLIKDEEGDSQLKRLIEAIKSQIYEEFECFIGASVELHENLHSIINNDNRFHIVETCGDEQKDYNRLISLTQYDYIGFFRSCDILAPSALAWTAYTVTSSPELKLIYGDEDRIDLNNLRKDPYFKPDFNYELFLSHNILGGFVVIHRDALVEHKSIEKIEKSDFIYDLAFRIYEKEGSKAFGHIARILNHIFAPSVFRFGEVKTIQNHLKRSAKSGKVMFAPEVNNFKRVCFDLPKRKPRVSIIIPTRDKVELLKLCISSIVDKTTYGNYDITIIDNGSVEPKTFAFLDILRKDPVFTIIRDDRQFNFSALNNRAIEKARGTYVCLMNNDIEILSEQWLEEMMSFAQFDDVGCVGARLWYPDNRLQHAGVLIGFHGVAGHMHKHIKRGETGYAHRAALHQSLSAVTAAVMLVKKSIYHEVGGLDESFAVAFNDVDFCLKVRDAGYRNIYTPFAEMYHHESASRGKEDSLAKKLREQKEVNLIKQRYGESMYQCPAYNSNLSITSENFSLAFPPRTMTIEELLERAHQSNHL